MFEAAIQIGDIPPILIPVGTAVVGFLLAFVWNRWWRKADDADASSKATTAKQGEHLISLEQRVIAVELRDDERQKTIGRLDEQTSRLEGKVEGLQTFWRVEFANLRRELRDDQGAFRAELREDQQGFEARLAEILAGHQQRVHDRLNVIAVDQAKLLTEFVDKLVDKQGA